MRQHALAFYRTAPAAYSAGAADDIFRNRVAAVAQLTGRSFGRRRPDRLGIIAKQHSADDVSRFVVSRAAAAISHPVLTVPRHDRTVLSKTHAMFYDTCVPEVLPHHLVLPRVLQPYRPSCRLRQYGRIEWHG